MEYINGGAEEKALELAFHEGHGSIEKHLWFGDGYIMVAFRCAHPPCQLWVRDGSLLCWASGMPVPLACALERAVGISW